jgi:cytochrome c biogenesis protein CcmG/thiol:disulfide interchange protein DsbE
MNRFLWPLIAFGALAGVLAVGLRNADQKGIIVSPLIGKPAPTFAAPNLLDPGGRVTTGQLRGGWHLVNIWGTWCVECRAEHATLLAIQREGKVPVVGLDWKDTDADAMAWLSQLGNPYQQVGTDSDGRIAIDWGVYGAPESFLVDPSGIVRQKRTGGLTPELWARCFLPHLTQDQPKVPAECT